jgi:hypothetical protein
MVITRKTMLIIKFLIRAQKWGGIFIDTNITLQSAIMTDRARLASDA